jgi:light-harvesting protein B-800-850 alpha chain
MNEGRIFLYVSPTVAIPLFFAAIVLAALLVHASLLNNTTWFAGYWQGSAATVEAVAVVEAVVAE